MAEVIELADFRNGYVDLVKHVRDTGQAVAPRGDGTREVRNATVVVRNPLDSVPWDVGRKLNAAIGAAETAQLIGGVSDARQLVSATPVFGRFTNDGVLKGAYGPRLARQLPNVVKRLASDVDTRQATATLWNGAELDDPACRDIPCTVALSWQLRDGELHATTYMRSNDVFLGSAYDFWMFTRLQAAIAWCLNVPVGEYTHVAASLHLYDRDLDKVDGLHYSPAPFIELKDAPGFFAAKYFGATQPLTRWLAVSQWARDAALGHSAAQVLPPGPEWYEDVLRPHRSGGTLCWLCHYVTEEVDGDCVNCLIPVS